MLGELFARYAARRGLAGVVVDGAVRDTAGLRALGFPVHARDVTPRAWLNPELGEAGVAVAIGGVAVRPGDWVVADDDGVAVIPQEQLEQVVAAGEAKERQEQEIAARIDAGEALVDITGLRGRVGL